MPHPQQEAELHSEFYRWQHCYAVWQEHRKPDNDKGPNEPLKPYPEWFAQREAWLKTIDFTTEAALAYKDGFESALNLVHESVGAIATV